jgi:glycosyltransferase involved in cell wall biosynthesis
MIKLKKVLVIASIPLGGVDKVNGYRQRVLSMRNSISLIGYEVHILWLYNIKDIFSLKMTKSCRDNDRNYYRPVIPFYCNQFVSNVSRLIGALWVKKLDRINKYDGFHAETALHGSICSMVNRKKTIVDFHGDLIAEMNMRGDKQWKVDLAYKDEKKAIGSATGILAASKALLTVLNERYGHIEIQSATAPCGVDVKRFENAYDNRIKVRKRLGLEERIVFCYLGGFDKWQNIEETLTLFKRIFELDNRSYLMIHTNSSIEKYKDMLNDLGDIGHNYNVIPLNSEQVPIYLPASDFGFLLRSDSPVNIVSSPTKFGEYLAAGLSVITTPYSGDAAEITSKYECGFIINDDDVFNIGELMSYIVLSVENRENIFEKNRVLAVEQQSWVFSEKAISDLYEKVLA